MDGNNGITSDTHRSSVNPYESPQGPMDLSGPIALNVSGPWRDGRWMVVRLDHRSAFPNRCLISGEQVDGDQRERRHLRVGPFVPYAEVVDDWPIDRQQVRELHSIARLGILAAGLIYFPLGIGICLPALIYLLSGESIYIVCIGFSAVIGVFCGIMAWIMPRPDLTVVHVKDGFAWIWGVHSDVLETMPKSPIQQ